MYYLWFSLIIKYFLFLLFIEYKIIHIILLYIHLLFIYLVV